MTSSRLRFIAGGITCLIVAAAAGWWYTRPVTSQPTDKAPSEPADPTGCAFISGARPMENDKFVLVCADGVEYLAMGEYNGENFDFSNFEERNPPK